MNEENPFHSSQKPQQKKKRGAIDATLFFSQRDDMDEGASIRPTEPSRALDHHIEMARILAYPIIDEEDETQQRRKEGILFGVLLISLIGILALTIVIICIDYERGAK